MNEEIKYSNSIQITHTKEEFILDFLFKVNKESILISRIITSPRNSKKMLAVLKKSIKENSKKYQKKY